LNFYDPVNKLLAKYGAIKVFLEGDAIILAILEREGGPGLASAALACWHGKSLRSCAAITITAAALGMPGLELGVELRCRSQPRST